MCIRDRENRLHSVLGNSSDYIDDYTTVDSRFDLSNYSGSFPIITFKDKGYKIKGELYSVTPETMDRVNNIESGVGYIPYIVNLETSSGIKSSAITYVFTERNMVMLPVHKIEDNKGVKEW